MLEIYLMPSEHFYYKLHKIENAYHIHDYCRPRYICLVGNVYVVKYAFIFRLTFGKLTTNRHLH